MSTPAEPAGTPRFLADVMLERLARWLRALGVDVDSAAPRERDAALAARARAEGRVVLTRDRRLAAEAGPPPALLVGGGPPLEQLRDVLARAGVSPRRPLFTRCLLCNVPLACESDAAAAPSSPDAPRGAVRCCPRCGRRYWEGGHTRRMRAALARALPELESDLAG